MVPPRRGAWRGETKTQDGDIKSPLQGTGEDDNVRQSETQDGDVKSPLQEGDKTPQEETAAGEL